MPADAGQAAVLALAQDESMQEIGPVIGGGKTAVLEFQRIGACQPAMVEPVLSPGGHRLIQRMNSLQPAGGQVRGHRSELAFQVFQLEPGILQQFRDRPLEPFQEFTLVYPAGHPGISTNQAG